jgi:hypothetical protein
LEKMMPMRGNGAPFDHMQQRIALLVNKLIRKYPRMTRIKYIPRFFRPVAFEHAAKPLGAMGAARP